MTGNTKPSSQSQAQSEKSSSKKPRRRLDHMRDLADGFDRFDMVPRKLSRAYIDGKFPESKFRLLLCMLSHSDGFHVKRAYLEERFGHSTLVKYLKELQVEGYIEVESVPMPTGGTMKLYHVRSAEDWDLYRQPADPPVNGGPVNGGPANRGLKDPKVKKESKNQNNNDDGIPPSSEMTDEKSDEIPSSHVRDKVVIVSKPENLRPSDYVNMIADKIKSAQKRPGKPTWIPKIELANQEAAKFIAVHGHEKMQEVCEFILHNGRISIAESMFFAVLPYLEGA